MPDPRPPLGRFGERLALQRLRARGYQILETNFRCPEGEIDIIARQGDCLVFIEVRTRRGDSLGGPAESVTPRKQAHLLAAAQSYLQSHDGLPLDQRIDVIAITLAPDGRLLSLDHIENAVTF